MRRRHDARDSPRLARATRPGYNGGTGAPACRPTRFPPAGSGVKLASIVQACRSPGAPQRKGRRAMEIRNPSPGLYNEDLAPARERKWGAFSIFNV